MAKSDNKSLIVEVKSSNDSSEKQPLSFLKSANDSLERVITRISNTFNNISEGEGMPQSKVDATCRWLSWKINVEIEDMRQKLIKALHGMYQSTVVGQVMRMIMVIQNFVKDPLETIGSFASAIFAPFGTVTSWIKVLSTEIPRLAQNLSKISSFVPSSSSLNLSSFKLKIRSISLSDITSNPSNLPSPETMFPEPEKPFSEENFEKTFTNFSAKLKSNKIIYKLSDSDKYALLFSSDYNSTETIA